MLPRRWVVERTIAWLNRCRRLAKDWENLNRKALAFLRLASIRLMLRKLCNPAMMFPDRLLACLVPRNVWLIDRGHQLLRIGDLDKPLLHRPNFNEQAHWIELGALRFDLAFYLFRRPHRARADPNAPEGFCNILRAPHRNAGQIHLDQRCPDRALPPAVAFDDRSLKRPAVTSRPPPAEIRTNPIRAHGSSAMCPARALLDLKSPDSAKIQLWWAPCPDQDQSAVHQPDRHVANSVTPEHADVTGVTQVAGNNDRLDNATADFRYARKLLQSASTPPWIVQLVGTLPRPDVEMRFCTGFMNQIDMSPPCLARECRYMPSPLKSPVSAIDQLVPTVPSHAEEMICVPFMYQIATSPAVSRQRMSL